MAFRARQLTGDVAGAELELIGPFRQLRGGRGDEPESRAMRMAALLALLYEDQERWDDAADYLAYGAEVDRSAPAKGKIYTPLRLAARARLALHEGRGRDALEIAESAVDAFGRGEWFNDIAPAWLALAEARRACGRSAEADAAFAAAMHLYEAKGNRAAIALLTARTRTA
jgi:tetratricopeptide (TPR) repeat protein